MTGDLMTHSQEQQCFAADNNQAEVMHSNQFETVY